MPNGLRSLAIVTLGLDVVAAAALVTTVSRYRISANEAALRSAIRASAAAVACQFVHFAEEYVAGFATRVPEWLGTDPLPDGLFAAFNLVWLAIWALAIALLKGHNRPALFPLWFLAMASVANGLIHPGLAMASGGYFPGLATSPLVLIAGIVLVRRLAAITSANA